MPFTGQNGKLVIVADVVRLLPRLWDGQRALRFLAGLAMLALAFAANAGLIGPSALPAGPAQLAAPAQVTAPAQLTGSAPARTAATSASTESVTLAEKVGVESAASSEATPAAGSKSTSAAGSKSTPAAGSEGQAAAGGEATEAASGAGTAAVSSAGTAAAGVSAVPGGRHGTVGLGVNPLVLAGLLGLLVVVVWAAGPGAGLFAGGVPARRGPPGR
ncbi:hypothetical protein Acsp02_31100 [Actinoplanes sp. NBRC 103695]|nr:hypothetical protein Acsp02_31100 [Actinoplanes sp. NBRC 103695]